MRMETGRCDALEWEDGAVRECAVEWLNSLPESEREQAKKEIR